MKTEAYATPRMTKTGKPSLERISEDTDMQELRHGCSEGDHVGNLSG